MAFHVRLTKHNLLKLSKFRAVPYATQADDTVLDRRHTDHFPDSAYKSFPSTDSNQDIQHDTHMFMSKHQPKFPRSTDDAVGLLQGDSVSKFFSSVFFKANQEFVNTDSVGFCQSRLGDCISGERSVALEGRKSFLPETCPTKCFLPMTLNDLQTILLCHDWNSLAEKKERCISDYAKPVSYTGDDILVQEGQYTPQNVSSDIISHENYDVTVLEEVCRTPASRDNSLDVTTMFCEGMETTSPQETPEGPGPSKEQLIVVEKFFAATLPSFLKTRQDYRVYHKDIILENNFWGKNVVSHGINNYVLQMNKVRILTHLKYAHAHCQILKITHHPEDGTVRIRWRISGLPQLMTLQIWKFMPWNYQKNRDSNSEWHDGFSTLTVGSDGLVHKHRVDRVMPDEELQAVKRAGLATRLAIMFGLSPKPSLNDFSSLFMKKTILAPK